MVCVCLVSVCLVSLCARTIMSACVRPCSGLGNPLPTYQWYKGGKLLARESKNELSLPHVSESDCDVYFCEVRLLCTCVFSSATVHTRPLLQLTNPLGSVRTEPAEVSLEPSAPLVFSNPYSQAGALGDIIVFRVEGKQSVHVWYHMASCPSPQPLLILRLCLQCFCLVFLFLLPRPHLL